MSIFGFPEMREFCENHNDPRVVAVWLQFQEAKQEADKWLNKTINQKIRIKELEEENKLLHNCRDACIGFHRDWLALGSDKPQLMTNRLVFEAGERFSIGPINKEKTA